jgi:hypothetical protein
MSIGTCTKSSKSLFSKVASLPIGFSFGFYLVSFQNMFLLFIPVQPGLGPVQPGLGPVQPGFIMLFSRMFRFNRDSHRLNRDLRSHPKFLDLSQGGYKKPSPLILNPKAHEPKYFDCCSSSIQRDSTPISHPKSSSFYRWDVSSV